jgi:GTP-binding protein EngB required for normal cell division
LSDPLERGLRDADRERANLDTLATALNYAIRALQAGVGDDSGLIRRLAGLRKRLQDNRLQLAVLGQFKRGKSTFINALLGAPLLPVAVVPLTAVPVFIAWRAAPLVRVRFGNGASEESAAEAPDAIRDFLFRYVAEEANPKNRLAVQRVDLFYPAALLSGGTLLIDTPGVGSTFRHNTEAALAVLPECDAALFVVSGDPPITEVELDYLRHIKMKAARVVYILNKIDYLDPAEAVSVADFLRGVLENNGLWTSASEIFCVSARNGLAANERNDAKGFEASGMARVERHLVQHLAAEKSRLFETAMRARILDRLSHGISEIGLRIQALKLPLDELIGKAKLFETSLYAIGERQRITRDVLTGEQRAIREDIEAAIASLRTQASSELSGLLDQISNGSEPQSTLAGVIERIFDTARSVLVDDYSRRTDAVLADYAGRIEADVNAVKRAAAAAFQIHFTESREAAAFALKHEPYWVTQEMHARLIPNVGRWFDRLLPAFQRAQRQRASSLAQIGELVVRNTENLRWALIRGTDETFRNAAASLQAQLDDAVKTTRGVIEEALVRRRETSFAIDADLERLNHVHELLSVLRQKLDKEASHDAPPS